MARQPDKKHRGVYEHPTGSGVWWIHYYADGRRHRERVGGKQAAINRYQQRKTEAREGRLPTSQRNVAFDAFVREFLEAERAPTPSMNATAECGSAASSIARYALSSRSTCRRGRAVVAPKSSQLP